MLAQTSGGEAAGILAILVAIVFALAISAVFIASVVWAYADAEKRGKSGCLVAILVAFVSWPVGLIIWLVARPNDKV